MISIKRLDIAKDIGRRVSFIPPNSGASYYGTLSGWNAQRIMVRPDNLKLFGIPRGGVLMLPPECVSFLDAPGAPDQFSSILEEAPPDTVTIRAEMSVGITPDGGIVMGDVQFTSILDDSEALPVPAPAKMLNKPEIPLSRSTWAVIDTFARHPAGITFSELSAVSGLPRATAWQLCGLLSDRGIVRPVPDPETKEPTTRPDDRGRSALVYKLAPVEKWDLTKRDALNEEG